MQEFTLHPFPLERGERRWLSLATIYHLLIGLDFIIRPSNLFELSDIPTPTYPFVLQLMGAGLLVMGIGMSFAQKAPYRHSLIWVMLLILKVVSLLVFVGHVIVGNLPVGALIFTAFHDLLWIPILIKLLWRMLQVNQQERFQVAHLNEPLSQEALSHTRDQNGTDVWSHMQENPVLLVFIRHFGCTFCRETMADLARDRQQIEASGTRIVVVHLSPPEKADTFFEKYGLADLSRISDPDKSLYQAFDLKRATFEQAFGWRSWIRGFEAGVLNGHWVGKEENDGWQMPGVFLLAEGKITKAFRHRSVADRPHYCEMVQPQNQATELVQP